MGQGAGLQWQVFEEIAAGLLYELLAFRQRIFVVEQACPYPDLDGLDRHAAHLVLRLDGELAGYLRLIPYAAENRVAIGRVCVAAGFRGRGLARLMMQEALGRCRRDHPGAAVTLTAQTYLQGFYESLGFRATSPPFDDYGLTHVAMALAGYG